MTNDHTLSFAGMAEKIARTRRREYPVYQHALAGLASYLERFNLALVWQYVHSETALTTATPFATRAPGAPLEDSGDAEELALHALLDRLHERCPLEHDLTVEAFFYGEYALAIEPMGPCFTWDEHLLDFHTQPAGTQVDLLLCWLLWADQLEYDDVETVWKHVAAAHGLTTAPFPAKCLDASFDLDWDVLLIRLWEAEMLDCYTLCALAFGCVDGSFWNRCLAYNPFQDGEWWWVENVTVETVQILEQEAREAEAIYAVYNAALARLHGNPETLCTLIEMLEACQMERPR